MPAGLLARGSNALLPPSQRTYVVMSVVKLRSRLAAYSCGGSYGIDPSRGRTAFPFHSSTYQVDKNRHLDKTPYSTRVVNKVGSGLDWSALCVADEAQNWIVASSNRAYSRPRSRPSWRPLSIGLDYNCPTQTARLDGRGNLNENLHEVDHSHAPANELTAISGG